MERPARRGGGASEQIPGSTSCMEQRSWPMSPIPGSALVPKRSQPRTKSEHMPLNIAVPLRLVPDLVEELEIAPDKTRLAEGLRLITNEFDEQALEQALILKEKHGAKVTVFALKGPEALEALATAVAKGADDPVQLAVDAPDGLTNHGLSSALAGAVKAGGYDLVLVGVQAVADLDGPLGGLLAARLALPYVGVVAGVQVDPAGRRAVVSKEFPGGLSETLEVQLPAVLGVQAAERTPRYVPVSKVRGMMKQLKLREATYPVEDGGGLTVRLLSRPQVAARAEILEGSAEDVAGRLVLILQEKGIL